MRAEIAIVGSGFAGSILARVLARQGHGVHLIESARHPRFALGESSTPLAALSLERLAANWDLPDLDAMAAWGRWRQQLPHLGRGLKRGFTFYGHDRGCAWRNDADDRRRLLVAASPNDEIADCHWLRADVDAHLAERAAEQGVELCQGTTITDLRRAEAGFELSLSSGGGRHRKLRFTHLVDASGRSGFLAGHLDAAARLPSPAPHTHLVAGHFTDTISFVDRARSGGATLSAGPYPDERAAVHHLLGDKWLYWLPFDDGRVSIGLVSRSRPSQRPAVTAEHELRRQLQAYPTLAECLAPARAVGPLVQSSPLAWRSRSASGDSWAMLPSTYAFYDPLFSTGIAWSLVAVERLADWGAALSERGELYAAGRLASYASLVEREAEHLAQINRMAWATMHDFDAFAAAALVYFAAASWSEARQRLCPEQEPVESWCWSGFLGAGDAVIEALPAAATEAVVRGGDAAAARQAAADLIAERDVAGLGSATLGRRIPVSVHALLSSAPKLGLAESELRQRLRRLRGFEDLTDRA
jgi:FADH2 O2-dependent halogenase